VKNSIGKIKLVPETGGSLSGLVKKLIRQVPRGRVATYGQLAALSGNPRASRAVVWLLHSCSGRDKLPWHRVINGRGTISLEPGNGYEEQRALLESEGVEFGWQDRIDLKKYLWPGPAARRSRK
jgi:methylated-DNA-protein-cysteine methyltransferase related protein